MFYYCVMLKFQISDVNNNDGFFIVTQFSLFQNENQCVHYKFNTCTHIQTNIYTYNYYIHTYIQLYNMYVYVNVLFVFIA